MRRRAAVLFLIAPAVVACGKRPRSESSTSTSSAAFLGVHSQCPDVRLDLSVRSDLDGQGVPRRAVVVTLYNEGRDRIRLVDPGDGSDIGARTPAIRWIVETLDGRPVTLPPGEGRCGSRASGRADEVFTLEPGTHRQLLHIGAPDIRLHGEYRVHFAYENDPRLVPKGTSEEVAALFASTRRCTLESGPLYVALPLTPEADPP